MAKNLLIVESPAKAKTLSKYLGKDYKVLASVGHVRDLPESRLGVTVDNGFELEYEINEDKKKVISAIARAAKTSDAVYLATDYDREGEAIAWHVTEAAKIPKDKQRRITFTEITRKAVAEALEHPREIDERLVDAQQARRGIDRLVGYPVSQLLWQKIRYGLSAGRVQSPALRLIVEREREIRGFVPVEYWTLEALLATDKDEEFVATLVQIGEKRVPTKIGRDSQEDLDERIADRLQAQRIRRALDGASWSIGDVRTREVRRIPPPPFITSSFQMEASRQLGLPARRAMSLAQTLYERGYITYMRTDSTNMSAESIAEAKDLVRTSFGSEYWSGRYSAHDKKVLGAQEAHECIHPTEISRRRSEVEASIRSEGGRDSEALTKVYDLVWKRTVASLMTPAVFDQVSADIMASASQAEPHMFRATGSTMKFDGFRKLYLEASEDDRDEEGRLPELVRDQLLELRELRPEQHFTQPPPRYSEASLVKELEERGIGRPSTYASILQTLTESGRDYTRLQQKRLVPTDTGEVTTDFLLRYFGDHFMDFEFTSDMEEHLDEIAEGKLSYRPVVEQFYIPLQDRLNKGGEVPKEEVTTEATDEICPDCGHALVIKLGRRGKFLACTNYPECRFTKSLPGEEEEKQELLDEKCPDCGSPLQRRFGRYGPFIGCSTYPECKYIKKRKAEPTGVPCPRCKDEPCSKCEESDGAATPSEVPGATPSEVPGATRSEVPAKRERAGVAKGRGELVERFSRRGKFFGCSHYPACRFTQNEDPRK